MHICADFWSKLSGRKLAGGDCRLRGIRDWRSVVVLESFIQDHKGSIFHFIADQVKAWDINQLVRLIEINVGRDLQFIRFNGAIVGGLAASRCTRASSLRLA